MQDLTSPMQTALAARTSAASVSRNRTLLFEIYDATFFPTAGVFDPSLATALWAKTNITWLGNLYQRRVLSTSTINKHLDGQFDNVTLTIENADRFLSNFIDTNNIDGMRLVVRYINIDLSATLADSVVLFVGRLQAPEGQDIDREQGDLTAKEELASLDIEIPRRRVSQDDPEGRSPNDPLYEGIQMNARPSMVKFVETETSRKFFFFTKKKDVVKYNQWSSESGSADAIIPLIGGRVQLEGLPIFSVDIGFYIIGIWAFAHGKQSQITDFQLPDTNYVFFGPWSSETLRQTHVHLGDPGGTGTNATPDNIENNYPQNTALLSKLAYVGFAIGGPETESQPFANPQMDQTPSLIAVILCEMELPDGDGVFNTAGFSDSPVYFARHVLTSADYFGLDERLIYDGELPTVHAERQKPIVDNSNGEFLALMAHDAVAVQETRLYRLNSTGLLNSRYFRHFLDTAQPDPLLVNRSDVYGILPGGDAPSGGDQQLSNGVSLGSQSVTAPNFKYYYIDTAIGADVLTIVGTGSGDAAIYAKLNSKPTATDYDYFVYTASPITVTIPTPVAGRWWIGVKGHTGTTTYSLIATLTGGVLGTGSTGNALPVKSVLRKAYTFNAALTDSVNASDFLNDVVLNTGRLYKLTDGAGRIRIRAKKASDSTFLIAAASAGDNFVLIANVELWGASLAGYLLINPGLTTSETRKITASAYYPTIGDTITLAVTGTGLTRSGATLSGGTTGTPSTGTVTVSGASGDLVVTIFGIPITYTVTTDDTDDTVAAMLTTAINADPNLRQYIRAVWNSDNIVHLNSTVGKLSFSAVLVNNHAAQVASPLTAPTATSTTSGTLVPGEYFLGYSLVDGSGNETLMSPLKQVTITSGHKVSVSSLGTLPTGAAEVNWYFSPAPNDDHVRFLVNNAGGSFTIDTVPDPDQDFPPGMNSTGGETIRVMEVFTDKNVRKGTFKWSPSRSKINQVLGTFVDSANGFKRTTVTVNDRAHQRNIRQVNKKEINLSAVDNFSQASRLVHATLAEERDAGTKWTWTTDDAGIPLEVGDVVALNDYNVNLSTTLTESILVNQPVIIEQISIQENLDVSFVGRVYSTSLLEGQEGRKPIVVASTLKYMTEAPPVATTLTLTINNQTLTGFLGDFDFGVWAGLQSGLIFIAGPSSGAPDDADYQLIDTVLPDADNHGHFEMKAATSDKYWIKIETQSQFGRRAATGHPVASIDLRPAAPTNFDLLFDSVTNNDLFEWDNNDIRTKLGRELYELQIAVPGSDTTFVGAHSVQTSPNDWHQYVIWDLAGAALTQATVAGVDPGGLDITDTTGGLTPQATIESKQAFIVGRGAMFEFELPDDLRLIQEVRLTNGTQSILISRPHETLPGTVADYTLSAGESGLGSSDIYTAVPKDRFSIVLRPDSQAQVFLNRINPNATPFFTGQRIIDIDDSYTISVFNEGDVGTIGLSGGIRKATLSRFTPEYLYTEEAERADNSSSLPAVIHARVRQLGFTEGGTPSDWTTGTFTRP